MRALVFAALLAAIPAYSISIKKESDRKRVPDFELKTADGKSVRLSNYAGRVVVIDFWATWCAPCRSSMRWLNELHAKYEPEGLTILGISMDADGWTVVKPFVEKLEIKYPIVLGTPRVAYLYGDVEELPLAFFVDQNQRIAAIHLGVAGKKEFEKVIKALFAGAR